MPDLSEQLQEIQGVGPATADAILDVIDGQGVPQQVREDFADGMSYLRDGQPGYAMKFFERVEEAL